MKFILMFSGGKDSVAAYFHLVEKYGKENVRVITFAPVSNNVMTVFLKETLVNIDIHYYDADVNKFGDVVNDVLTDVDASEYYLVSGETDSIYSMSNYYAMINKYKMKGLYVPFLSKSTINVLNSLRQYNCKFIVTSVFLRENNEDVLTKCKNLIGEILTVDDLLNLYSSDPTIYNKLQTQLIDYKGCADSNILLSDVLDYVKANHDVYIM